VVGVAVGEQRAVEPVDAEFLEAELCKFVSFE